MSSRACCRFGMDALGGGMAMMYTPGDIGDNQSQVQPPQLVVQWVVLLQVVWAALLTLV